jgi:hypothetical protein
MQVSITRRPGPLAAKLIPLGSAFGSISFAQSVPASGTHARGEVVFKSQPSAGGKIGWVCTTAGTPGTWKEFGAIDA